MKLIEKAAIILTLLLFLAAAGLTIGSESAQSKREVELAAVSPSPVPVSQTSGLVNINTANLDELCTLSGIGPTLGQRIIDYRTQYGFFSDTADIIDVTGIGFATFEKIKDYICV